MGLDDFLLVLLSLGVLALSGVLGRVSLGVESLVLSLLDLSDGLLSLSLLLLSADLPSLSDFVDRHTDDGLLDSGGPLLSLLGGLVGLDLLIMTPPRHGPGDLLGLDLSQGETHTLLGEEDEASAVLGDVLLPMSGVDSQLTETTDIGSDNHF